jgi:hypothetical protein
MHMRGDPSTMRELTDYDDVVVDVRASLHDAWTRRSLPASTPVVSASTPASGCEDTRAEPAAAAEIESFFGFRRPVLVGPSRKSFIGHVLDLDVGDRLEGTAAAVAWCAAKGVRRARPRRPRDGARGARGRRDPHRGWRRVNLPVRRARVSGGELAYVDIGEGPRWCCCTGSPRHRFCGDLIPVLSVGMRVVSPDLLGYGERETGGRGPRWSRTPGTCASCGVPGDRALRGGGARVGRRRRPTPALTAASRRSC